MLKEWKKCKDVFKKPKKIYYFGFWSLPWFMGRIGEYLMKAYSDESLKETRKYKIYRWVFDHVRHTCDPGLPVWRRGNTISLFSSHWQYNYKEVCNDNYLTWQPDFKEKLDRWHLGWLKPQYELPTWLSCYIFNHDMIWKWKYDDVRHEFNPQFTIVLFNICFSIYWVAPYRPNSIYDMYYWETILNYNHKLPLEYKDKTVLDKLKWVNDSMGYWGNPVKDKNSDEMDGRHWNAQPNFIKNKEIAEEIRKYQETIEW